MKRSINTRICLLVIFTLVLCASVALAQETTAGIQGIVKDPTGAVVSNATVEISGPALIGTRKGNTDSSGFYRFSNLPPGSYTLTITASSFKVAKRAGIDLQAGRLPNLDFSLELGQNTETVEVTGIAPIVDVTQSKVAVTVSREEIDNMPQGRSFQTMIPFAAGARQEPLQSARGQRNSGYQIDGASDGENVYLIDGINTTDVNVGGVGKSFQTDFIQEVQIKSSSFEAEFGGALGGVINAVAKRGSNNWHGEFKTYLELSALDANDNCASGFTNQTDIPGFTISNDATHRVCGQRLDPTLAPLSTGTRQDGTPQYYVYKKDQRSIITPGYEIGGPIFSNKLWLFSSYIPQIDTTHRTTTFTGPNPGPRELTRTLVQHNMYNRLDYGVFNSLRLFAGWNYAYTRVQGQLGTSDSPYGQRNTGASTDPNSFRSDAGTVNPLAVYSFGGDWTPTAKAVIATRYGYFFSNNSSRGVPSGTRYIYDATINSESTDLIGQPFPANSSFNDAGFANIPSNFATLHDAFKRKSFTVDGSYFVGHAFGSHTLKGGYFWTSQSNGVLITADGNVVDLFWGQSYTPLTSTTACDTIVAQNIDTFHAAGNFCGGQYGYFFTGSQQTSNTGTTSQTAHALYVQDTWTVGHGLTLNLGIRFDKETLPPYDAKRFPTVAFGWGDKIAPRIGGAYDLLHNGKVKIYASYGKFFDIMKMNLARGSFGSDYWHECVYALDSVDYTSITPTLNTDAGCPPTGPAPGVTGRFIENVDFRATKADPRDPAIDTRMKPMSQHEFVTGVDWAITPTWSLETRYSRKRLDNAIEDMAITDNLGFYVGNPGSTYADVLHRPVVIPDDSGVNYLTTVPFCAECPGVVKAVRRYDGAEFRLTHRATKNWYGFASYTYSKLTGNYPGLTNSDPTDGNGGRHNPNNTRLFDIPTMTYLPNGKIDDGPLSTDRPHSAKVAGFYRIKWFGMETGLGLIQSAFQGTPINTCLPVVGTSSACQWAEGRDGWTHFTRTPGDYQPDPLKENFCTTCGDFVAAGVSHNFRTDTFFQTDLTLRHEIGVSKSRENMKLVFEANVTNLFNQRAVEAVNENVNGSTGQLISPTRASRFSGDPQVDWGIVMNGYNYVDALNGTGAFAGKQSPMTLASRYGLPTVFQTARQFRLTVRFRF